MELRHLRYFVCVAEIENVSRAALGLHISQPGLSRQIRDLEDELGVLLLERTAKSVSLTEAGRVFLKEARAVLERADQAIRKAQALAGADTELHVGHSPTPTARILPAILRAYQRAAPHVRVRLHDWRNDENLRGLREGRLHLAFVWLPSRKSALRRLRFEPLTRERACLAVSPKHPFARRDSVSLAEAAREPFVTYNRGEYQEYNRRLQSIFAQVKAKLQIVEEHDGFSSLIPAIESGRGVAFVSESFVYSAGKRVKLVRLTPEPKFATLGIAAPSGALSAAADKFWQCARDAVSQTAGRPS
ncbi:MAG: LysR family transcriptional regulator [Verrucomicrobia bacterium]|nr:LysR family transcriptional regulator [Verrucomicrobiota bacterium]